MPRWQYRAYDRKGEVVEGRVTADTESAAFGTLEGLSLSPTKLEPVPRRAKKNFLRFSANAQQSNLVLVRQLSSLTDSGIPMLRAVAALADLQSEEIERQKLLAVGQELRRGQRLSEALKAHMRDLPAYVPYLVEVGEATGDMAAALNSASVQLERDLAVSRDIKAALTYPMFLVFFGIAAVIFMFAVVVPQFSSMLKKSDAVLPTISVVVIATGSFVSDHIKEAGFLILALFFLILLLSRSPRFGVALFQLTLGIPGIGRVVRLTESGRWASMLATLLSSRVTITDAITVANRTLKALQLRKSLAQVEESIRRGTRLSDALEDFTAIDPRVVEMVRIGEQSGGLDRMLASAAALLRDEAEVARKRFISLIEPLAILAIGGSIALIVVGLMLAITSLYDKIL